MYCCFFFFKQKTAYEVRISDWSSDVCSSDLPGPSVSYKWWTGRYRSCITSASISLHAPGNFTFDNNPPRIFRTQALYSFWNPFSRLHNRSEEHTSELQSLMRISYAVFCFKINNVHTSTLDLTHYIINTPISKH